MRSKRVQIAMESSHVYQLMQTSRTTQTLISTQSSPALVSYEIKINSSTGLFSLHRRPDILISAIKNGLLFQLAGVKYDKNNNNNKTNSLPSAVVKYMDLNIRQKLVAEGEPSGGGGGGGGGEGGGEGRERGEEEEVCQQAPERYAMTINHRTHTWRFVKATNSLELVNGQDENIMARFTRPGTVIKPHHGNDDDHHHHHHHHHTGTVVAPTTATTMLPDGTLGELFVNKDWTYDRAELEQILCGFIAVVEWRKRLMRG